MKKYDIAVIGAGPAGIMAAITASQSGKRVILIDRNPQLGRKLLATGNGRCNLTNLHMSIELYHGANPQFIDGILSQFDQHATLAFFKNMGLVVKEEENGRIFPRTNQASSVVEVLRHKLIQNHVDVMLDAQVTSIAKTDLWKTTVKSGKVVESDKLIIATGGRASHYLGSTGDGLYWAQKLGHSLTPIYPALVPIETIETWPSEMQGIKVVAKVWATCDGKKLGEKTEDLLFTSYGVSGPSVMALARSIAPRLKTSKVQLHIDLFPEMDFKQLDELIKNILDNCIEKTTKDALVGLLPSGIIPVILKLAGIGESRLTDKISQKDRLKLVETLKDLTLTVSKLRPLKEAFVTAGGLDVKEINPKTLESKLVDGLYFAGEIIDVDADSGGFNLQWAWASGFVAGQTK